MTRRSSSPPPRPQPARFGCNRSATPMSQPEVHVHEWCRIAHEDAPLATTYADTLTEGLHYDWTKSSHNLAAAQRVHDRTTAVHRRSLQEGTTTTRRLDFSSGRALPHTHSRCRWCTSRSLARSLTRRSHFGSRPPRRAHLSRGCASASRAGMRTDTSTWRHARMSARAPAARPG